MLWNHTIIGPVTNHGPLESITNHRIMEPISNQGLYIYIYIGFYTHDIRGICYRGTIAYIVPIVSFYL